MPTIRAKSDLFNASSNAKIVLGVINPKVDPPCIGPVQMINFAEERPRYEMLTQKLEALLRELLPQKNIVATIESRTKTTDSFDNKVCRPGKAYGNPLQEITDLSGVRIILRTLSEVATVGSLIEQEFAVNAEKSVRKIEHLATDQFGYLSEHYIINLKEPRLSLPEWRSLAGLSAEIQVRTILQHAWAAVQHSLDYKTEVDIPKQLRRRLFRLSALFELADQELDQISDNVYLLLAQYEKKVQSFDNDIELNVDSLRVYLENSETVARWARFIEALGVQITGIGLISRDVEMSGMAGISTIREIDDLLKSSEKWGEQYLREFFRNTFGETIPVGKCAMDRNGIVTVFLIANYLDLFTEEILERKLGWGQPERATVPAKKFHRT